jgi:hypothetical protein
MRLKLSCDRENLCKDKPEPDLLDRAPIGRGVGMAKYPSSLTVPRMQFRDLGTSRCRVSESVALYLCCRFKRLSTLPG